MVKAVEEKELAAFSEQLRIGRAIRVDPSKLRNKKSVITVFTDGSARDVPYGFSSWAWYVNDDSWDCGVVSGGNNPSAEGLAIFQALTALPVDSPLVIVSHSHSWMNIIGSRGNNGWMKDWAEHGWIKKDGTRPANLGIAKALYKALDNREAPQGFKWIKERKGTIASSESVMRLASRACDMIDEGIIIPRGPGWTGPGSEDTDMLNRRPPPPPLKSRRRTMERF